MKALASLHASPSPIVIPPRPHSHLGRTRHSHCSQYVFRAFDFRPMFLILPLVLQCTRSPCSPRKRPPPPSPHNLQLTFTSSVSRHASLNARKSISGRGVHTFGDVDDTITNGHVNIKLEPRVRTTRFTASASSIHQGSHTSFHAPREVAVSLSGPLPAVSVVDMRFVL